VVIVLAWTFAVLSVVGVALRWQAPPEHWTYRRAQWFPYGESLWQGYRRAALPAALIFVCIALALTLPTSVGVYFALAVFVVNLPLALAIILFNRPKFLVPPACRDQRGVLSRG
jgi:hypothetical protein